MTSLSAPKRIEAERWFLHRGLPAVLRPAARLRRLWSRSAPALAAFAVMMACSVVVVFVSGKHSINIDGQPTRAEWFVLAVVVVVIPLAGAVGWLVSRLRTIGGARLASTVSVLVAVLGGMVGGPSPRVAADLLLVGIGVAGLLLMTASGAGSVLGWAVRMTMSQFALTGTLFIRALPVVLLTVLVFFNTYVWLMAATISRSRLWLALGFLTAVAAVFLVSSTLERVRPMLASRSQSGGDAERLAETPFAAVGDPPASDTLSRGERANVVFVLAATQIAQVAMVAIVTAAIFFVLGLILLSPELLSAWTRNGSRDGTLLGMTFPVPQSLIQITLFLGALTFMYVSARAVEGDYRSHFLDPLIDDLRLSLIARNRYRVQHAGQPDSHKSGAG
jgi:hypothetical protein